MPDKELEYRCCHCKKVSPSKEIYSWKIKGTNYIERLCRKCQKEKRKAYDSTPRAKQLIREAAKRYYQKSKSKSQARVKLGYAVKSGKLIKPTNCEVCEKRLPLQGHHEDYSKPLEVIWLCLSCHADADREREKTAVKS